MTEQSPRTARPGSATCTLPRLTVRQPMNQPDIVVVSKHQKTTGVIDVAILSDSNIRKKKHRKF